MWRSNLSWSGFVAIVMLLHGVAVAAPTQYTRITPVQPRIIAAATAFPGGYDAENILSVAGHADYASFHLGERTFIDFDFGQAEPIAAFRHVQRHTPDTIAEANLVFSQTPDFKHPLAAVKVQHVDKPGATTFASFTPINARYVRWQVTSVLPGRSLNVGGRSIEFFAASDVDVVPHDLELATHTMPIIKRRDEGTTQPLKVTITYPYAESTPATVHVAGQATREIELTFGSQTIQYAVPAMPSARSCEIRIDIDGRTAVSDVFTLPPTRILTVYILPHSHTDIGYTALQTDIEEKQMSNLLQGLAAARHTANYPADSRFVWNVEVLWAADLFLHRMPESQQKAFLDAVQSGQVALNGMYLNELTGLCRPEELTRLFHYATQLGQRTGVPIDAAMISDVPGYTWGTVTAMNQAGIRYFSVAPNYFDRIGTILVEWENKPFWWIGPDGKSKVLVWIPFWGYAMSHVYRQMSPQLVEDFCEGLTERDYPYDIAYARWSGIGDNAVPDPSICDFIKDWNATHESPHFIVSSTSQAFHAFEQRYGDQLPEVRGDWTPYWEDGAGSSALETAMNRASSDRLAQAETLWAMQAPKDYPSERFFEAWRNVLLYSEHTWGAYCSVTEPSNPLTSDQWNMKRSYALNANYQSRQLLHDAAYATGTTESQSVPDSIDVFNTTSWPRTEVLFIPQELSRGGNAVVDDQGQPIPAQRLSNRELAVLISDLPPLSGRRLTVQKGPRAATNTRLQIDATRIENDTLQVHVDERTGGIAELRAKGIDANLVDTSGGRTLNDFLYFTGADAAKLEPLGPVTIKIRDRGPLVASLQIVSDAPGCHQLLREVRVVAGADSVELIDSVDKKRLEAEDYRAAAGKESVNFGFPFNVPGGTMRLDVPYGVIRPEQDQMPSACKNWLTIGRWADISNQEFGITWVTLDAPLLQVGGLTANLLNSQTDPSVWRKTIEPTTKLYSWAMNNHWGTNYRAYQEGPVVFRYAVRPHRGPSNDAEASRFAIGCSQRLVVTPARGAAPRPSSLLRVEPDDVIITGLKPSEDRTALIIRLLNPSARRIDATLIGQEDEFQKLSISDTSEQTGELVEKNRVEMTPWSVVTVRAELAE